MKSDAVKGKLILWMKTIKKLIFRHFNPLNIFHHHQKNLKQNFQKWT